MRRNYRTIIKVVFAILGALAGICACFLFAKKYHNVHAAVWAGVSAVFALFFLHIVFSVLRDIQRKIPPSRFIIYKVVGAIGTIMGLSVFIAYLVIGATKKESVDPYGSYVVVVWGFMTFKWSLFSMLSARSYYKKYTLADENQVIVNS
ncbi:heme transporter hrg1-A-like [Actinia tenebrosa]|uniref:Heme transporter hrg1-A-like n=1 Tax=Actinia tenebrosa TaxID=6105 RepID=A0A6P8IZS2_ACTTE|nr:heme transporter hrg1-A-like [Actinia tenebrosa]